jgi:hypothetical protein
MTVVVIHAGVISSVEHHIDEEGQLRAILDDHMDFPDADTELLLIDHHHEDHSVCDFRLDDRLDDPLNGPLCLRRPNLTGFEDFQYDGFCPDE